MEGLVAFFLESTFLGVWIFGWDRLSKKLHLACIWLVAAATMLSAAFIMAANSWMQHPVGYVMNAQHQPVLNDIWALFTNPVFLWSLPPRDPGLAGHRGRWSCWPSPPGTSGARASVDAFRRTAIISLAVLAPAVFLNLFVGSELGVIEGTLPADEDRRRRGPVEHLRFALLVLPVPDRRGQQRRDAHPDLGDPRPAVHPGHQPPGRRGAGA